MREELAKVIQERVGLDDATALQVADVALDFVKSKVPEQFRGLIDGQAPDVGSLGGALGGLFGRRDT